MSHRIDLNYGAVQNRSLTDSISQYKFHRKANTRLCNYLRRYPVLPDSFVIEILDEWDFSTFTLNRICYEVEPSLPVNAFLLVPRRKGRKAPGILALHQHNDEYKAGKSETVGLVKNPQYTKLEPVPPDPSYETPQGRKQMAYARELCERGFVVLAPDFIGFEEYRDVDEYYDEVGFIRGYEEMLSSKYLLYGSCLMAKHLHDLYVAVSILSACEAVDPTRIGVFGHSLGGEMAIVLTTFDSRIKAGASSGGALSYDAFEQSGRMETAEATLPNFRADGHDFDFFLDMIPPTPFLLAYGKDDPSHQMISQHAELEMLVFEGGHELPKEVRESVYSFLTSHLR